jgi:hypothetical protein
VPAFATLAPYKNADNDAVVYFVPNGLVITPVDPTTGRSTASHPSNFDLTWTGSTTAKVSDEGGQSCGDLTVDPVKAALTVTGCDPFAGIYQH